MPKRLGWTVVLQGSIPAILMGWFVALSQYILPGFFLVQMECRLCGQVVEKRNAEGHLRYFHPESLE